LSRRTPAALAVAVAIASTAGPALGAAGAGAPAPDFTLPGLDGVSVRLADLTAKGPVVMAFFATWCIPCAVEVPHLSALQERYGAEGLSVVGISLDEADTVTEVRAFVRRLDFRYPVLLDTEGRVAALYNPEHAMPFTVVIGRHGRVRHQHRGYVHGDEVQLGEEVAALLAESAATGTEGTDLVWGLSVLGRREVDWERARPGEEEGVRRDAGFLRTRLDAKAYDVSASVRYDVEGFVTGDDPGLLRGRPGFVAVEWGNDWLRLRGGDTFVVLGRGLLLHLNQVGSFGTETTVLGGQAEALAGLLSVRLFGGLTRYAELPQLLEGKIVDMWNPIAGVRLEARMGDLTLGVHGLETRDGEGGGRLNEGFVGLGSRGGGPDGFRAAGSSLEVRVGDGGLLYGEAAWVQGLDGERGQGGYGSLVVPSGPLTVTVESKGYSGLDLTYHRKGEREGAPFSARLPYNAPPTLEPSDLVFKTAPDTQDSVGVRGRVDVALAPGWTLFGSLARIRQESTPDQPTHTLLHPIAGLEASPAWGGRYALGLGYREEHHVSNELLRSDWIHSEAKAVIPLAGRHSLDVIAQWKAFLPESDDAAKNDLLMLVTWAWAPSLELALGLDRRDTPVPDAELGNHPFGSLTWRPDTGSALILFAGSDPGGLRCTSGVCRTLPAFRGVRLEASLRF